MVLLFLLLTTVVSCWTSNILPDDYWGTYLVTTNAETQDFGANGFANYRWDVTHTFNSRFPIGSNTKLFTATAIYQLHEQGLLNVNDSVTEYLDENDFKKMGINNMTKWCPIIYNDSTGFCQKITFVQLLSMSSGLLPVFACQLMYNKSSPLYSYCWDYCTFSYLPYKGSIAYYVSSLIIAPMIFKPGTQYSYNNMNFILASYIVEKLSNQPFGLYLRNNIFNILSLNNTYCDLWDGEFYDNKYRVDEYYLTVDEQDPHNLDKFGVGWCHPVVSMGMSSGSGCIISNVGDMNSWYTQLFNKSVLIPPVFKKPETRELLISPYTLMSYDNTTNIANYYSQGVMTQYTSVDIQNKWPSLIYYGGATFCSHTAMKMVPNNTNLVISAFSNALHVLVNGTEQYNQLKYDTPYSICEMAYVEHLIKGDNGLPYELADLLLKLYT